MLMRDTNTYNPPSIIINKPSKKRTTGEVLSKRRVQEAYAVPNSFGVQGDFIPVKAEALCSCERVIQPDVFCLELLKNTIPNVTGSWQEIEVQFKVFY